MVQQTFGDEGYCTLSDVNPAASDNLPSEAQKQQKQMHQEQQQQSPSFQQQFSSNPKSVAYNTISLPTSKFITTDPEFQTESAQRFSTKIREQAEQITRLEKYRILCEKRILSLYPNHPLPVTPNHFKRICTAAFCHLIKPFS